MASVYKRLAHAAVNTFLAGTFPPFFKLKRALMASCGAQIGKNVRIVGPVYCSGKLVIGDNCWIGKNFTVNGNGTVEIGDDCDIGPEVTFETGGHAIGAAGRRAGEGRNFVQRVGKGSWIGGRATFVNNAVVGESSVIAACACVTGVLPANCLAGGVPARIIAFLSESGEKLRLEQKAEKARTDSDCSDISL